MILFGRKIDLEQIYIYSVAVGFGLLFFANSDNLINTPDEAISKLGIGKVFYYPCGLALLVSLFMPVKKDIFLTITIALLGLTLVSSILNPPVTNNIMTMTITRFVFAILCFKKLTNVDPFYFARVIALLSPIIVIPHYVFSNPFGYGDFRYSGFYGDANFLALSLLLVIIMCIISYKNEKNIIFKCLYVISIVFAIPLIFFGRSRSGMISLAFVTLLVLNNILKKSRLLFISVLLVIIAVVLFLYRTYNDSFLLLFYRFSTDSDTDVASSQYRIDGIYSAFNVFMNRPELIPFGIGMGNSRDMMGVYANYGYIANDVIHNSFVAIMFEAGIFVAILYSLIFYKVFRRILSNKRYILLGLFVSLFLALFTLPGVVFMPGWIALFFLCNDELYNPDNDKLIL